MRKIILIAVSLLAVAALSRTASAATQPPSLSALADKARDLATLADSAAKRGIGLPVGLYPAVSRALSANANYSGAELAAMDSSLQAYRDELNTLVSNPGIVGTSAPGPTVPASLVAGGTASIVQKYVPGSALGPGSAILVARHWMDPWRMQANQADGSNYVSVSVPGDNRVQFSPGTVERNGIDGGLYVAAKLPFFEVQRGTIEAGQAVIIRYTRLHLPGRATRQFPLPIYVRFGPDGPFLPVPPAAFTVGPAPLAHLGVYAPSVIAPGKPFKLAIKFTDRFGNPATGNLPPLDVLVDGTVRTRVPAGTDSSPSVSLALAPAGQHTVTVNSAGGGLGASATVLVEDNPPFDVRWTDLHVHTSLSDALQGAAEIHQRLDGVLDDVFLIDHDNELSSAAWAGRPVQSLDGFEWSAGIRSGGHHLVLSSSPFKFAGSPRLQYPRLADLVQRIHGPNMLVVALPEIPADARYADPDVTRLVEIKAGTGTFEWFGNRFAQRGFRVGFTGSSTAHNHQAGPLSSVGRTAVMVKPNESLFDALRARRTWVTSGPRIYLAATVNGGDPGERVAPASARIVTGTVVGTAGIARIDLMRNGREIDTRDLASDPASQTVRVSFFSGSAPVGGHDDLPRNGREWIGYISTRDAAIASVDGSAFRNPTRQAVAVNPQDPARVDFITWTRGQPSSFSFDVANSNDATTFDMSLKSGFEDDDETPRDRAPAAIPPLRLTVALNELQRGKVVRRYDVDGYSDTVTFELVKKQVANSADFRFTDERPFGQGDYYYIRVTQVDDEMAWSSPVWVGGFDPPN